WPCHSSGSRSKTTFTFAPERVIGARPSSAPQAGWIQFPIMKIFRNPQADAFQIIDFRVRERYQFKHMRFWKTFDIEGSNFWIKECVADKNVIRVFQVQMPESCRPCKTGSNTRSFLCIQDRIGDTSDEREQILQWRAR